MPDDWCETMDMPKLGCAHCRPPAERRRLDAVETELKRQGGNTATRRTVDTKALAWTATVARMPGRCGMECGDPIGAGEEIVKVQGYGWAHLACTQN